MSHGTLTQHVLTLPDGWEGTATFSGDRTFRYVLSRSWHSSMTGVPDRRQPGQAPYLACIGTNPSAADETVDDQTVRLLCNLARRKCYYGLTMLNAYAFRATSPRELRERGWPVGPDNDAIIRAVVCSRDYDVLACWGGIQPARDTELRDILRERRSDFNPPFALRLTAAGQPCHPLHQKLSDPWIDLP